MEEGKRRKGKGENEVVIGVLADYTAALGEEVQRGIRAVWQESNCG